MAYYPDCGHEYCDCPSYPGVVAAQKAEWKADELQKKNDQLRAELINAKKSGGEADGLKRKVADLEGKISTYRGMLSQMEIILNDAESDEEALKLIRFTIKSFRKRGAV